ncbi:hypothetical protein GAMM_50016 [Gammaproteobacteria bacterium]
MHKKPSLYVQACWHSVREGAFPIERTPCAQSGVELQTQLQKQSPPLTENNSSSARIRNSEAPILISSI